MVYFVGSHSLWQITLRPRRGVLCASQSLPGYGFRCREMRLVVRQRLRFSRKLRARRTRLLSGARPGYSEGSARDALSTKRRSWSGWTAHPRQQNDPALADTRLRGRCQIAHVLRIRLPTTGPRARNSEPRTTRDPQPTSAESARTPQR